MIHTKNIEKIHSINSLTPDYLIQLPLLQNESINEEDVTCYFIIQEGAPYNLKCVGIEYYKKFDKKEFQNDRYKNYVISYIYVYKGKPFDIEKERKFFKI